MKSVFPAFLTLFPSIACGAVVINEIHCEAEPTTVRSEFVELFNDGAEAVDLSGWRFADGIDYTFPAGTTLAAGAYLAVAENLNDFARAYSTPAGPQVIAHWHFDETSGTTAADTSGSTTSTGELKTAIASGGVNQDAEGRFGGSGVAIDGLTGSSLTIPHLDALWDGSYTLAAWVKPSDTSANAILADLAPTPQPQAFLFSVDTAAKMTHRYNASMPATTPTWTGAGGTISANTWQHVAAVWDRESQVGRIYLNGALVYKAVVGKMPAELAMVRNARPWSIGRKQDNDETFNGLIDELWVIRGALPGSSIATLMNENRIAPTEVVDLADIVGGGDGSRPGTGFERGIDAATGQESAGLGTGDHTPATPGEYYPAAHPLIDGVFVPNGTLVAGQPVTTTGLTAIIDSGDADPSPGHWFNGGGLIGDPSKVNGTTGYYLPRYLEQPLTHSILSAMTQKGITFDLNAIEAAHDGRQVTAFTALAADSRIQTGGNVAALIFVDGVERFRQAAIANAEQVIDLVIPADARFLTLVLTNSDGNNANDHGYFADPFLHLEAAAAGGPGRTVLGPYVGNLSSTGEPVSLRNAAGTMVDEVDYQTEFPWPVAAGGEGMSLELIHPALDNQLGGSWRSSLTAPTPGARNTVFATNAPPQIRQVDHTPKMPAAAQPLTVTAKITDHPQGVGSVQLHYQIVLPGSYVPSVLALTPAQVIANPSLPRPPNPAFEDPANWTALTMLDDGTAGDTSAGDGLFTAVIPGQINRTLVRYRITAVDTGGASVRVPYADDPSLNFAAFVYDGVPDYVAATRSVAGPVPQVHSKAVLTSLPVYSLLTAATDFTKCVAYSSADQIPSNNFESREAFNWNGTFVYDGEVYDHIRYRLRQRNDRYGGAGKRSLRFRFNRGRYAQFHDFDGTPYPEKWRTLNTHKMSARGGANMGLYEMANSYLWRVFGCPAPSVHWFHFRVVDGVDEAPTVANGQHLGDFFGLLLALEDYDSRFLSSRNLPDGNIYKLNSYILNGKEVQRYQAPGSVTDASDFYNILFNLVAARTPDWLNTYVDYPAWYRYHTVVDAIRHYDVAPNRDEHLKNRAWYFRPDPATRLGKLVTLPWDSDTSWGPNWNGGEDYSKASAITANKADFVRDYRNVVREFRDLVWQRDQIEPMLDLFQARIGPFQVADRDRWMSAPAAAGSQNDGPFATRVADMKRFAFIGGSWEGGNDPADAQSKDTGLSGQQGRDAYLDYLQTDAAIPATPAISYSGAPGFPANGLAFTSSAFSDPQGDATFGAMEWRIAEYRPGAIQPDDEPLIASKATWKFNDLGTDLGTEWRTIGYNDSAWASGPGEFGYGETGLGTTLSFGPDTLNRWPTYYLRRTFTASELDRFTGVRLSVRRDDGAVVYLNGVEVFRTGMPAAPAVITYATRASAEVAGTNETTYFSTVLPITALVAGENTIAVELHQFNAGNADLRFDLTLGGVYPAPPAPTELVWEYEHRWKSPLITPFAPGITIPAIAVRENRTYRARVRHQDSTGRWSHWSAPVEFLTASPGIQPLLAHLAISEIMFDPPEVTASEALGGWTSQDFEWIELENRSSTATLDLTDVRFTKGVDVDIAQGTSLAPGARCLVVRSRDAFALRHGAGPPVVGEFLTSRLDNGGEPLKLSFGGGVPVREFRYDDDAPWPEGARGTGAAISFLPGVPLDAQGQGVNWRAVPPTPGAANVFPPGYDTWARNYFHPSDPDFAANSAPGADADGDGQTTVVEYLLGSSPALAASIGALEVSSVAVGGQTFLAISFLLRPDVTVSPQASTDLSVWTPISLTEVSRTPQPDGSERVTMRALAPSGDTSAKFIRVGVSKP